MPVKRQAASPPLERRTKRDRPATIKTPQKNFRDNMKLQEIGAAIAKARKSCKRMVKYPEPMPENLDDAYAVQEHMARAMEELLLVGRSVLLQQQRVRQQVCVNR